MDDFRDLFDPDVAVMRFIEEWPEPGPVLGRDAVMTFYDELRPWGDTTAEPVGEFVEAGGQVVVRVLWRASTQGQEVGMEISIVYAVRNGKIARIEFFRDHADALAAVCLST
jgi:ketosteroid isomerase-like protein